MSMYPSVKGIVAYCNANRTNAQCHSSKGYALNQVMTACCGPQASRCASGTMPSTCNTTCASAFLPFYSQCGRVVWRNGQQLTKMVHFAIMCAKTRGMSGRPSTNTACRNRRNPVATKTCLASAALQCFVLRPGGVNRTTVCVCGRKTTSQPGRKPIKDQDGAWRRVEGLSVCAYAHTKRRVTSFGSPQAAISQDQIHRGRTSWARTLGTHARGSPTARSATARAGGVGKKSKTK